MKGAGKYGLKHDFKTFTFKIKCVHVREGHSVCLYSFSLIPSYKRVYDNLRHITGMANRDFIFCYVDARLPLVVVLCFVCSCAIL